MGVRREGGKIGNVKSKYKNIKNKVKHFTGLSLAGIILTKLEIAILAKKLFKDKADLCSYVKNALFENDKMGR